MSLLALSLFSFARPVPGAELPRDQWVRAAGDYASTRYSKLAQINAANVKQLKRAWTFDTSVDRGQKAAPLIIGATMYVVTPYPNIVFALGSHEAKCSAQVEVRTQARAGRSGGGVL